MATIKGVEARAAKYTDGPNGDGYYTAGIDMACSDIFGKPDWHLHAIEFHSKDKAEAESRRDTFLAVLAFVNGEN